jgi:FeS assembly protein IscX
MRLIPAGVETANETRMTGTAPMSDTPDDPKLLYWEASYEIVLQLIAHYPDVDLDNLGLEDLNQMIVSLPGFADDPALAHDELLVEILREYYEEATSHDE